MKAILSFFIIILTLICFMWMVGAEDNIFENNKCVQQGFKHCWLDFTHSQLRLKKNYLPEGCIFKKSQVCENCGIIKLKYVKKKEIYVYVKDIANWAFEFHNDKLKEKK